MSSIYWGKIWILPLPYKNLGKIHTRHYPKFWVLNYLTISWNRGNFLTIWTIFLIFQTIQIAYKISTHSSIVRQLKFCIDSVWNHDCVLTVYTIALHRSFIILYFIIHTIFCQQKFYTKLVCTICTFCLLHIYWHMI